MVVQVRDLIDQTATVRVKFLRLAEELECLRFELAVLADQLKNAKLPSSETELLSEVREELDRSASALNNR